MNFTLSDIWMLEEAGNELVCPLRMVFPADGGQQRDYRVSSGSGSGSSNNAAFFVHLDLWRTNYPNPQITIWAQDLV